MSENSTFLLKDGIFLDSYDKMTENYVVSDQNISACISAQNLKKVITELVKLLPPDVFFFIEIPLDDQEGKYQIYYLDNCTTEVALAIIKRYGDILFSDGLVRFGFGSHKSTDEIYMQSYQVLSVYSPDEKRLKKAQSIISSTGSKKVSELLTLWDFLSEKNQSKLVTVEANGETYYNIVENLTDEGMYPDAVVD